MFIQDLGWNEYFAALWQSEERCNCAAARVISQQRGFWSVAGEFGEVSAESSGRLRLSAEQGLCDWPAVGDWVAAEIYPDESKAIIQNVLPRRSKFSRKEAGKRVAEQVLATNVDKAIVVGALDDDFNLRRIERYVTQCWDSGANPILVLNKSDASERAREFAAKIQDVAIDVPVFVLSARTGAGCDAFEASLKQRETVVFLGSSGVGKSTLVNRLLREERQATSAVRESDSRGKHTTTARQLFRLPNGAIVIDTPGLRELQLWDAQEGVAETFRDISEFAARCRFRDCRHESEPGCAVRAALEQGTLDGDRLANMKKLQREEEFLARKMNLEKQHEYKKRIKICFRAIRRDTQSRDKSKN